jgi:hypothetical protein
MLELTDSLPWRPYVVGLIINTVVLVLWRIPFTRPPGFGRKTWVFAAIHIVAFVLTTVLVLKKLPPNGPVEDHGLVYYFGFAVGAVLAFAPVFAYFICVVGGFYTEAFAARSAKEDVDSSSKTMESENPYEANELDL